MRGNTCDVKCLPFLLTSFRVLSWYFFSQLSSYSLSSSICVISIFRRSPLRNFLLASLISFPHFIFFPPFFSLTFVFGSSCFHLFSPHHSFGFCISAHFHLCFILFLSPTFLFSPTFLIIFHLYIVLFILCLPIFFLCFLFYFYLYFVLFHLLSLSFFFFLFFSFHLCFSCFYLLSLSLFFFPVFSFSFHLCFVLFPFRSLPASPPSFPVSDLLNCPIYFQHIIFLFFFSLSCSSSPLHHLWSLIYSPVHLILYTPFPLPRLHFHCLSYSSTFQHFFHTFLPSFHSVPSFLPCHFLQYLTDPSISHSLPSFISSHFSLLLLLLNLFVLFNLFPLFSSCSRFGFYWYCFFKFSVLVLFSFCSHFFFYWVFIFSLY